MCIEMLHVFQRVESIHKTQPGFSLEYQNLFTRYMQYKYAFLRQYKVFLQANIVTYSYLVCFRTANDASCKIVRYSFVTEMFCTDRSIFITLEATRRV